MSEPFPLFECIEDDADHKSVAAQPARLKPRPYQLQAIDSVFDSWREHNSCLLNMATGTGKTAIASMIADRTIRETGKDVIFIANRNILVDQADGAFTGILSHLPTEVEQSGRYASRTNSGPRIVVASLATIYQEERLLAFDPVKIGAIVVDECHSFAAKNVMANRVLTHFRDVKRVGLTATMDRLDGQMMNQMFSSLSFVYDLHQAIMDSWLVPISQVLETVDGMDISGVPVVNGDLSVGELSAVLSEERARYAVTNAAQKWSNYQNGRETRRPTIIFCPNLDHANGITDILNRDHAAKRSGRAEYVDYRIKDRADIYRRFKGGESQYLVNVGIVSEGADFPAAKIVVMAAMTLSRAKYEQRVGRITRPHPSIVDALNDAPSVEARRHIIRNSSKPSGLVVDLVGVTGRHKLISFPDIMAGHYDPRVAEIAKAKAKIAVVSVQKTMEEIQADLKREEEIKAQVAARRAVAQARSELRKNLIVKVRFTTTRVDPFNLLDRPAHRSMGFRKGKPLSEKQAAVLRQNGVSDEQISSLSQGQAGAIIAEVFRRREAGVATFAMARILRRYGEDPDLPIEEAKLVISEIQANGWQARQPVEAVQ